MQRPKELVMYIIYIAPLQDFPRSITQQRPSSQPNKRTFASSKETNVQKLQTKLADLILKKNKATANWQSM